MTEPYSAPAVTTPGALAVMSETDARRVTEEIRHTAKSFVEYRERLMGAVEKAKAGSAHVALGYKSWTAYLSDVLGEEPMRLARAERQDMVRMLSDEGMSTRAIAGSIGVSKNTVTSDLSQTGTPDSNVSPDPTPPHVNSETGEIIDEPVKTTGMDGKQYSRPNRSDSTRKNSKILALLNDIRGPWRKGITLAAKQMTANQRGYIIEALEGVLYDIREMKE